LENILEHSKCWNQGGTLFLAIRMCDILQKPTDCTGSVMRIRLSTAPLAFRLKGAGGGTVDNRNQQQGLHLRNCKTCPNKLGHLYVI